MEHNAKIYVAGHTGLVGGALMRQLQRDGYTNIITRSHHALDLRNQQAVNDFFETERPEYVFLCAARVGGIKANAQHPADFIYDNLMIEANVIKAAYHTKVKKLLFLGSSCIYPRDCPQPIKEEYLLTSILEETNKPYALAKIAGIVLCQSYNRQYGTHFISCMPTNLYGPGDTFHAENSHVIPALIKKMDDAKRADMPTVTLLGTGSARREFLYVDDLAKALVVLMNEYEDDIPLNVGTGYDITIYELAHMIKEVVGFTGALIFDNNRYFDGTPQKLLSVERIHNLGWCANTDLHEGLNETYQWYCKNVKCNASAVLDAKEKQVQ